ncbi:hypothetical protein JOC93_004019, partial [Priestia taiwanensis]|nr:hypothetical protein [Priestia taiwanensis]
MSEEKTKEQLKKEAAEKAKALAKQKLAERQAQVEITEASLQEKESKAVTEDLEGDVPSSIKLENTAPSDGLSVEEASTEKEENNKVEESPSEEGDEKAKAIALAKAKAAAAAKAKAA